MSFYEGGWWESRYKIRTNITLSVNSLLPGSESLCGVKLRRQPLVTKIKPDFSDLKVIRHVNATTEEVIPFYVVVEDAEYFSVIFEPTSPILETENNEYYLYYCGRSESRLEDAPDVLDIDNLTLQDLGQLDENTRWTFERPTVYWINNVSSEPDSKAVFEFTGHKADFYFMVGPKYGRFEYQITTGEKFMVDCYNAVEAESKVLAIDTNELGTHKIRFTILGQKNPASSSDIVELVRVEFHEVLIGETSDEEFYSEVGNVYVVGS